MSFRSILSTRRRRVVLAIGLCALIAQTGVSSAAGTDPRVSLTVRNDIIYAVGRDFPDSGAVDLIATIEGGNGSATINADGSGRFILGFRTPAGFAGDVSVAATSGVISITKSVTVEAASAADDTTTTAPVARVKATANSSTASSASPSGEAMPVGNLSGWKQVFTEDFNANTALGSWPGSAYSAKWDAYNGFGDTAKTGQYATKIISVNNGVMDMYLHTENGTPLVAAPVPKIFGSDAYQGQTYGRYSVRFKADAIDGYKTAWLLWPDTNQWTSEIDFPEGELSGTISAYNHCPGNAEQNCGAFETDSTYDSWHTATTEWTADAVKFYLDGKLIGTDNHPPKEDMHMVLQTETNFATPLASSQGHVQIDWVAVWAAA